jgi:hypothetical protein
MALYTLPVCAVPLCSLAMAPGALWCRLGTQGRKDWLALCTHLAAVHCWSGCGLTPLHCVLLMCAGMERKDWLALCAVHSDAWLMGLVFFYAARFADDGRCAAAAGRLGCGGGQGLGLWLGGQGVRGRTGRVLVALPRCSRAVPSWPAN